jgi:predicted DNA-binding protein (MmcQ/YjbR family)
MDFKTDHVRLAGTTEAGNVTGMRLDALRQFALSLPHTRASEQWGGVAFKVEEKVFLLAVLDAATIESVIFKCTPEEFAELTEIDGIAQAPYFAKRHWVSVADLLALPATELERRIRRSYDLVVANLPKKVQASLIAPPPARPRRRR